MIPGHAPGQDEADAPAGPRQRDGATEYRPDEAAIRRREANGTSWNLGMKIGLTGLASLAPLALLWIGCAWYMVRLKVDTTGTMGSESTTSP